MEQDSTNLIDMSVIIPAHNEADYIIACLIALTEQTNAPANVEILLSANACTDETVSRAIQTQPAFEQRGWTFRVLTSTTPGKLFALNCADGAALGKVLVYLDADVLCGPNLLGQVHTALDTDRALYATGKLKIAKAKSWITHAYGRFWAALPFVQGQAVGAGFFAVNRAGRARWGTFPNIISDDTFVRLQFEPNERVEVPEIYTWPLVEGFKNLVKVRHRQDRGVTEIDDLYPGLRNREDKPEAMLKTIILNDLLGFAIYASVKLAVRLRSSDDKWTRGR